MARPRKPGAERRTRMIGVRATTAEAAEIADRAAAARMTKGGYMRRRALGQPVREAARLVPVLRGNAEQPSVQQVGERVLRRPDAALDTLPGRIAGQGATRRGGRHGPAHAEPPLCRTGHTEGAGRSRPRPEDPDRHRRSAGRGPTPSRPATCGIHVPHNTAPFRCTSTPTSNSHLWIGNGLRRTALKSGLQKGGANAVPNGCRFQAVLRLAGYPKTLWNPAETASEPSMEERRLRNTPNVLLTGPARFLERSVTGVDGV